MAHQPSPRRAPVLPLMQSSYRVAFDAVLRAPTVGHFVANLPKLWEEFVPHAVFEDFDRTALERFRAEADSAMNQLHVFVAEFLEELIEFGERLRDDVSRTVVIFGIVNAFDREAVLFQVVLLERIPDRLIHFEQDAEAGRL